MYFVQLVIKPVRGRETTRTMGARLGFGTSRLPAEHDSHTHESIPNENPLGSLEIMNYNNDNDDDTNDAA